MNRARDLERHTERLRNEEPLDLPPRHALRAWCVWVWWIVALFFMVCTVKGW